MKASFLVAVAGGAMLLSVPAMAQSQGQQPQPQDVLQQFLGAMFGSNVEASEQTLDSDWNQGRRPFAQRRAQLDARIDTAVRDGSLSSSEAAQMRREYDDIVRLEAQYSANGPVSAQERSELRARYRALVQRVDNGGYAGNYARSNWPPVSSRNAEFEQAVASGLRSRRLSQSEANRLRTDWRSLAQVEAGYQRGGIDAREQADLWRRFDSIDARLGGSLAAGADNFYRDPARWTQMETRLATAERNGRINRAEAVQVRAQLNDLARLDAAYATGGYSADERSYLARRYADMEAMLGSGR